jgi:hypothetical protein
MVGYKLVRMLLRLLPRKKCPQDINNLEHIFCS